MVKNASANTDFGDGFAHQDAGLMPFDGLRGGRMPVSTAAIRRFSWRKRPLILPIRRLAVSSDFSWSKRPELKLFDIIPVTFGSKLEPEVRKALDEIEESIPDLLSNANMKVSIEEAWKQLHDPIEIDVRNNVSMVLNPTSVAFTGIDTNDRQTRATFAISGQPTVYVGEPPSRTTRQPLPSLSTPPDDLPSIRLSVPIVATYESLTERGSAALASIGPINLSEYGQSGELRVQNLDVRAAGSALILEVDFRLKKNDGILGVIDVFGLLDIEGRVTFMLSIRNDESAYVLTASHLDFDSSTNSALADALVEIARMDPIRELIRAAIHYNYSAEAEKFAGLVDQQLNRNIAPQVAIRGSVTEISLGQVSVLQDSLAIPVRITGAAEVIVGGADE